uniref:Uncharacterized protein n=1 Tax=Arundo donax TaxID=35708 RepID=A0A0A8ZU59_ARUDO
MDGFIVSELYPLLLWTSRSQSFHLSQRRRQFYKRQKALLKLPLHLTAPPTSLTGVVENQDSSHFRAAAIKRQLWRVCHILARKHLD